MTDYRIFKYIFVFLLILLVAFGNWPVESFKTRPADATVVGQMRLYMHKEPSDRNETLNSFSFTSPEPAADTASGTTSTVNFNPTAPAVCESSNNTGETFNRVSVANGSAASTATAEKCFATFISSPVGQAVTVSVGDTAPTTVLWVVDSATGVTGSWRIRIYKWNGTSLATGDIIATLSSTTDPGTTITSATWTSSAITAQSLVATDRVIAIVTRVFTSAGTGNSSILFDSSARAAAYVNLKYTTIAPNKPALSGSEDDDFTTGANNTNCSTAGVTYNTKWTCLNGTAASTTGLFNVGDTAGTTGDTSHWLRINNQITATTAVPLNFGATPSNTWMYQTLPASYGDGTVRTVVNSSLAFVVGSGSPTTPFRHAGLVLWTSNTNYLEVQVYATAAKGAVNTAKVALNNCTSGCTGNNGTLTAVNLNTSLSNGFYNRVWIGFTNTGGSYQAQYSTDGTTWNNIGSAVAHADFSRVGLNVFNRLATPVSTYSGAFEWFESTLAAGGLPANGDLTSATYDTGSASSAAYNSISWEGNVPGSSKVRFQLATSTSSSGPWNFIGGATCAASDWYDATNAAQSTETNCFAHNNKRYYRYKIQLCSAADCTAVGTDNPTVTDINVSWSP